jgi:hypothetical protein
VEPQRIEEIDLENGLILQLFDTSRLLAGDRWLVSFLAMIDVDVRAAMGTKDDDGDRAPLVPLSELLSVLGEKIQFRYEKKSYFVDIKQKDVVFHGLKKVFLATSLGYLNRPGFAKKFVMRKYDEAQKTRPRRFSEKPPLTA